MQHVGRDGRRLIGCWIGYCCATNHPLSIVTQSCASTNEHADEATKPKDRRLSAWCTYPKRLVPRLHQRILRARIRDIERARHVSALTHHDSPHRSATATCKESEREKPQL